MNNNIIVIIILQFFQILKCITVLQNMQSHRTLILTFPLFLYSILKKTFMTEHYNLL